MSDVLYIPRKCWQEAGSRRLTCGSSYTNRLITAKDHASVQINFAKVDESGRLIKGQNETVVLCGYIRSIGRSDLAVNCISQDRGLVDNLV